MSDYTQVTSFGPKDALASGNPSKLIRGTEYDTEFAAIATAIATKFDSADVASNADADVLTSDAVLMTPAKVGRSLANVALTILTLANASAAEVGFRGLPQNSQSGNYTLVLADTGKLILHPSGAGSGDTFTIPANASVAFPVGTLFVVLNLDASNSLSIAITTDTLTQIGTGLTGTRTLAALGIAWFYKATSTQWVTWGIGET